MTQQGNLRRHFVETYLRTSLSPLPIMVPSLKRKARAITTIIIDTPALTDGSYTLQRIMPLTHSTADILRAAHDALSNQDDTLAHHLSAALPPVSRSSHKPITSSLDPVHHTTWHNGATYTTYWFGDPIVLLQRSGLSDTEREHIRLMIRKLSTGGDCLYATAVSTSREWHPHQATPVDLLGLVALRPKVYPGTLAVISAMKRQGITIIYASSQYDATVLAVARTAQLVPRTIVSARHASRTLPMHERLYSELTHAEKKHLVSQFSLPSAVAVNEPLTVFWRAYLATTR